MWNMLLTFEETVETARRLLELEFQYAEAMCHREKKLLPATIGYTEWGDLCAPLPRLKWLPQLVKEGTRHQLFYEAVVPNLRRMFNEAQKTIPMSKGGFLWEPQREFGADPDSPEELLTLHFRNKFAPDSPFDHRDELEKGLLEIVEECESGHPGIKRVQCAGWLNNLPAFLSLFPAEWNEERTLCFPMEGSIGWWGSFIDRRGHFHEGRAEKFLRLGGFTCPGIHCRCTLAALKAHLKQA